MAIEARPHATARDVMRLDKRCCRGMRFAGETAVGVRACLDAALVQAPIGRNPG